MPRYLCFIRWLCVCECSFRDNVDAAISSWLCWWQTCWFNLRSLANSPQVSNSGDIRHASLTDDSRCPLPYTSSCTTSSPSLSVALTTSVVYLSVVVPACEWHIAGVVRTCALERQQKSRNQRPVAFALLRVHSSFCTFFCGFTKVALTCETRSSATAEGSRDALLVNSYYLLVMADGHRITAYNRTICVAYASPGKNSACLLLHLQNGRAFP